MSTDLSINFTPNFIQNTDILITLGSSENKGVHNLTTTSKVGF